MKRAMWWTIGVVALASAGALQLRAEPIGSAAQGRTPTAEGGTPAAEAGTPAGEARMPTAEARTPTSQAASGREASPDTAEAILRRLGAYAGHWRSDEKEGPEGNRFHFEYELAWMDAGRTIARLVIERVEGGSRTVVFEGFKGREPSGDGVYYVAASPSGRGARGEVLLEGADLVTVYDGWTADGSVVEIRDVFAPVEDGGFVSRTFLRQDPDPEWRQIGEDIWTRVGAS